MEKGKGRKYIKNENYGEGNVNKLRGRRDGRMEDMGEGRKKDSREGKGK